MEGDYPGESGWGSPEDIRYMTESSTEAFWRMDNQLKFTFTNDVCEQVSGGFTCDDFIGTSLLGYLTPEGVEHLARVNGARLRREATGIRTNIMFYELEMRRKNGIYFWAGISSCPLRDESGTVVGYQGIMRDISAYKQYEVERRRLKNLLKKEERMAAVGKMAGGVAHELNNVMAGIIGYSELLLLQEGPENQSLSQQVGRILHSGERAAALIADLLLISGKDQAEHKPVNLNELLPSCLKQSLFQKNIEKYPGLAIELDLEPSLRPVRGSLPRLGRAFTNLLCLCCEKAGRDGSVLVATRTVYLGTPGNDYDDLNEGEYVVLSITDNGAGIAEENLSSVFEPFYMRKALKRGFTGLELVVLREVVKDHGGHVHVASRIGEGATFTVYLPLAREKQWHYRMMPEAGYPVNPLVMN